MEAKKRTTLRVVEVAVLVGLLVLIMGISVSAASTPAITGASYDISTGKLTVSGTIVAVTKGTKDLDPSKFVITDSKNNVVRLTAATRGVDVSSDTTSQEITLGSKDQVSVAQVFDKVGTAAMNGGTYKLYAMAGWNGASATATEPVTITVASTLPSISSVAYDYTAGTLAVTGTNLLTTTGSNNDVLAKYLAITDKKTFFYVISAATKGAEVSSGVATMTLSRADKAAFEMYLDQNGTQSTAGDAWYVLAFSGWNGASLANAAGVAMTVSNWLAPSVTVTTSASTEATAITIGTAIKAKMNKVGWMYVVASATAASITDKDSLDALVNTSTAVTAVTSAVRVAVSKTDKDVSIATNKLSTPLDDITAWYIFGVDKAGRVTWASSTPVYIKQKNSPAITIANSAVAQGTAGGSTKFTATAGTGNLIGILKSTTSLSTPVKYADLPTGVVENYTGGNITGVGVTSGMNKYIGVYEYDSTTEKVVKFKQITLSAAKIKGPIYASCTAVKIDGTSNTKVTVSFDEAVAFNVSETASKALIKYVEGGTTKALGSNDSVTINTTTKYLEVTIKDLSAGASGIQIGANALKDDYGNKNAKVESSSASFTAP